MSIQVRLEINPLTVPHSYWIRFVPRNTADEADIAADVASKHPNFSQEVVETILKAADEAVFARLLNGEQVSKKGGFRYYISFTGRLDSPDDPLPPLDDCLHVSVRVSPIFLAALRQQAHTERLPMEKKLPQINLAFDTILKLNDVLNPTGVLQLVGDDLFFDEEAGTGECVLEGTNSGRTVQTRFVSLANNLIQIMPEIPTQTQPWHNEYQLTVSTHYTERGSTRTGTYARLLRTPLAVQIGNAPGILSSSATDPLVTVTDGELTTESARVRIQVLYDLQDGDLRCNLLDMKEGGQAGDDVRVAADGVYTLPGWTDSDVTSLEVTVADYAALFTLVRNTYAGRLVDVLDITMGT